MGGNIKQDASYRLVSDTEKNTWNGKAARDHVHSYAGSSSVGGPANSAVKLSTPIAGSDTRPVYFSNGKPTACTYSLNKSVPSNAVFTDTNTTYPISYMTIDANFSTQFRTQTKRNTAVGDYISTIRCDTAGVTGAGQYGSGLAWGRGDTHGYIYVDYAVPAFYAGGGNADKLNWIKQVSFSDHTHAYLPLSGGALSGSNQTPLTINGVSNNEASICYRYLGDVNTDWVVGPGAGIGDMTYFGFYTAKNGRVATLSNGGGLLIYSIKAGGEIQSTGANAFRSVFGNYGMIFRNDGVNCYIMPTNSGDPYGSWNDNYIIISFPDNQWQFVKSPNDLGLSTSRGYPVLSETNADRIYSLANKNAEYLKVRAGLGTYHCTFTNSDIRLKQNIKDTEVNALDFINKIKIRQFDWKDKDYHQSIGFIADELEELDSNLSEGGGYEDAEEKAMDIKSVNTFYLQGYEVKAIQELSNKVDELLKRIAELENK